MEKLKKFFRWLWTYLKPFTNWRFLICFGLAWFITNGMWYPIAGMIPAGVIPIPIVPHPFPWMPLWLVNFARAYIVFLFLPFTPEKLVTIPIAIWLLTKLFKNHKKTRAQLDDLYAQAKSDWAKAKVKIAHFKPIVEYKEYLQLTKRMRAETRRKWRTLVVVAVLCCIPINGEFMYNENIGETYEQRQSN